MEKNNRSEIKHQLNSSFMDVLAAKSQKYRTALLGFIVLLSSVAIFCFVNSFYQASYEAKASEELFKAEVLNNANIAMEKSVEGMKKPDEKVNVDMTQVIEKLTLVILDYPKSVAALQAGMTLSEIYQTKNESQKALDTLQNILEKNPAKGVMGNSIRLKLSSYYEKGGNCEKVLETLKPITELKKETYLKPEALLRSGLCYEALGKADEAKQAYQKLTTEHLETNQGQQAQKYLKILGNKS